MYTCYCIQHTGTDVKLYIYYITEHTWLRTPATDCDTPGTIVIVHPATGIYILAITPPPTWERESFDKNLKAGKNCEAVTGE